MSDRETRLQKITDAMRCRGVYLDSPRPTGFSRGKEKSLVNKNGKVGATFKGRQYKDVYTMIPVNKLGNAKKWNVGP